jgi:hypothetical protein
VDVQRQSGGGHPLKEPGKLLPRGDGKVAGGGGEVELEAGGPSAQGLHIGPGDECRIQEHVALAAPAGPALLALKMLQGVDRWKGVGHYKFFFF